MKISIKKLFKVIKKKNIPKSFILFNNYKLLQIVRKNLTICSIFYFNFYFYFYFNINIF